MSSGNSESESKFSDRSSEGREPLTDETIEREYLAGLGPREIAKKYKVSRHLVMRYTKNSPRLLEIWEATGKSRRHIKRLPREKVIADRKSGKTEREIAEKEGVTAPAIRLRERKAGLPPRPRGGWRKK